jgi:copper(I)-binding protein
MRRVVTAFLIALLTISLTGCGAGLNAETRNLKQVTDGAEAAITTNGNNIKVVNLLIVETANGAGVLVGTLVNSMDQEDTLLGLAINGQVATLTGTNALAKNTPVIFEGPTANAKAVVQVLGAKAGESIQVTLFFARAGEVTVQAIIRDQRDDYAGITA